MKLVVPFCVCLLMFLWWNLTSAYISHEKVSFDERRPPRQEGFVTCVCGFSLVTRKLPLKNLEKKFSSLKRHHTCVKKFEPDVCELPVVCAFCVSKMTVCCRNETGIYKCSHGHIIVKNDDGPDFGGHCSKPCPKIPPRKMGLGAPRGPIPFTRDACGCPNSEEWPFAPQEGFGNGPADHLFPPPRGQQIPPHGIFEYPPPETAENPPPLMDSYHPMEEYHHPDEIYGDDNVDWMEIDNRKGLPEEDYGVYLPVVYVPGAGHAGGMDTGVEPIWDVDEILDEDFKVESKPKGDDEEGTTAGDYDDEDETTSGGDDEDETTSGGDDEDETTSGGDDEDETTAGGDDEDETTAGDDDEDETTAGGDDEDETTAGGDDEETTEGGDEGDKEEGAKKKRKVEEEHEGLKRKREVKEKKKDDLQAINKVGQWMNQTLTKWFLW